MVTDVLNTQMVSASTLSVGDRNTDDDKKSSGRGDRPACRYVTIPPEHVSRCDQGDVADDNGVSSVSRWGRHQTFARLTMFGLQGRWFLHWFLCVEE